jgi:sugar lactone lactonase YvrE
VLLDAPRLDQDDTDDRPLNFSDDRQALLVADTSNKRIIRHFTKVNEMSMKTPSNRELCLLKHVGVVFDGESGSLTAPSSAHQM